MLSVGNVHSALFNNNMFSGYIKSNKIHVLTLVAEISFVTRYRYCTSCCVVSFRLSVILKLKIRIINKLVKVVFYGN